MSKYSKFSRVWSTYTLAVGIMVALAILGSALLVSGCMTTTASVPPPFRYNFDQVLGDGNLGGGGETIRAFARYSPCRGSAVDGAGLGRDP